jgi:hypothetical protein
MIYEARVVVWPESVTVPEDIKEVFILMEDGRKGGASMPETFPPEFGPQTLKEKCAEVLDDALDSFHETENVYLTGFTQMTEELWGGEEHPELDGCYIANLTTVP